MAPSVVGETFDDTWVAIMVLINKWRNNVGIAGYDTECDDMAMLRTGRVLLFSDGIGYAIKRNSLVMFLLPEL